ncbi:Regulation of enolase protein 1, concanavalin A-like superfamily [Verrucomicrobium sp. GAS474]|uniref:hypothetical protein n=1 Tax=Verrucomicrobium sp. GAS474 TaxID=1882831 RepID=UPI00087C1E68|nr:hypothetical protein [Verrucomicrobium sp. GAS474]SDT94262.1 Regulation of enolase protein 1, concanavalin A-like superfamily [Verrucomicrobium sp. GAS474]
MKIPMRALIVLVTLFNVVLPRAEAALPAGWSDQDIGTVTTAGSASYSGGVFTVSGSGADINGNADAFHYAYQSVTGNFTFITRVTGNSGTNVNTGAPDGIMIREALTAGAREEMIYVQPGGPSVYSQSRVVSGGGTSRLNAYSPSGYPLWLKLQRDGDMIALFFSTDGATWTPAIGCNRALPNLAATVCIGLTATSRSTSGFNTVTYDNVSLAPLVISTETSWLGNTYAGGQRCVQYHGEGLGVNPATGALFVNGSSEDVATTFYDTNGNWTAAANGSHFNGSNSVVWDSANSYVWVAQAPFSTNAGRGGVAYYKPDGTFVGSVLTTSTTGPTITGVAISGGNLYAIDSVNTLNATTGVVTVHVISLSSKTETPALNFNIPAGAHDMAADSSGNLWIVFTGATPRIGHYTTAGALLGNLTLTGAGNPGLADPKGIAIDPSGNIYVADNGVNQQIQVFTSGGAFLRSFGAQYGVYSTVNGTVAGQVNPGKLDHPRGIAIDGSGNLYVACNGPDTIWYADAYGHGSSGLVLRKYNSTTTASAATLLWERLGTEGVDCAAADPTTDGVDVYTKNHHYTMDYSKAQGLGWTLKGTLVNNFAYPGDARLSRTRSLGGAAVRVINGKKYLVSEDPQGSTLHVFRFQSGSEVTVPYASFIRETNRGGTPNTLSIWVDSNLDGQANTGDVQDTAGLPLGVPSGEIFDWSIDDNGDVWTIGGQNNNVGGVQQAAKIWRFKMTLDANGNPTWSSANNTQYALPAEFTAPYVLRVHYVPATDTMYLGGYTTTHPRPTGQSWGYAGTELIRYNNWGATRTIAYRIVLPFPQPGGAGTASSDGVRAFDVKGNLLAATVWGGSLASHPTYLYNATTGSSVAVLTPGPEVGNASGNIDINNAVTVHQRANGEYLIFVEEDEEEKCLIYRWNPWTADTVGTVPVAGTTSYNASTGTFTLTGSGLGCRTTADAFYYVHRGMTGDGTLIAQLNTLTCSVQNAYSGIMMRDSMATNAMFIDGVGTTLLDNRRIAQYRTATGAALGTYSLVAGPPTWYKLVRAGNVFTTSCGTDGTTWTLMSSQTIPMGAETIIGFPVASNSNSSAVATTTIGNVQIVGH